MVPHKFPCLNIDEDWCFVVEKPGLDVARLGGAWDDSDMEGGDLDLDTDIIT